MKKKTQIHLERWEWGQGQKTTKTQKVWVCKFTLYQIPEHLKKQESNDPFSQVKEKLKLDQKIFKREQWVGALNLGAGAPSPLRDLVSSAVQWTDWARWLQSKDSMKLSWILHLVATLYKRLVKVLLISKKDYSTIKCYKDEDLASWTPTVQEKKQRPREW